MEGLCQDEGLDRLVEAVRWLVTCMTDEEPSVRESRDGKSTRYVENSLEPFFSVYRGCQQGQDVSYVQKSSCYSRNGFARMRQICWGK
jgi:hypothetical protein